MLSHTHSIKVGKETGLACEPFFFVCSGIKRERVLGGQVRADVRAWDCALCTIISITDRSIIRGEPRASLRGTTRPCRAGGSPKRSKVDVLEVAGEACERVLGRRWASAVARGTSGCGVGPWSGESGASWSISASRGRGSLSLLSESADDGRRLLSYGGGVVCAVGGDPCCRWSRRGTLFTNSTANGGWWGHTEPTGGLSVLGTLGYERGGDWVEEAVDPCGGWRHGVGS